MTPVKSNTRQPGRDVLIDIDAWLRESGLRPTRHRLTLMRLLFPHGREPIIHDHHTAETLFHEVRAAGGRMSLATVYNTLNQLTHIRILRRITDGHGRIWFDTNTEEHHHLYHEDGGRLEDVPLSAVSLPNLGKDARAQVMISVRKVDSSEGSNARTRARRD